KSDFVVSLSRVAAWLGVVAEGMGAEIYPGFAGARLLLSGEADAVLLGEGKREVKSVRGVITHDVGLMHQCTKWVRFEPGGAHRSLSKQAISMYGLREGKEAQTYDIGMKKVWRAKPEYHTPGQVLHTLGWPLNNSTYGGGWEYHMADGLVSIG
ncbi:hypothetical protein B0H13DRAFT_1648717, partial [Mycena leptocephala]